MANEIKIPCEIWPHPSRDANAYEDTLVATNNEYVELGLVLPDGVLSRICFRSSEPLPTNYASDPKLIILWKTTSTDTSNSVSLGYEVSAFTPDTDSEDPSSWSIDSASAGISAGANITNQMTIDISTVSEAAGDFIKGTISRAASDTLVADVIVIGALIVGST